MRHSGACQRVWAAAMSCAMLVGACAPATTPDAVEPPVVEVTGTDFAFVAPDTVPPGLTRFRFRSSSSMAHEVAIGRVKSGVSLDSVIRVEVSGGDIVPLYDPGFGLLYVDPGETVDAELLVNLESGRDYVLVCTLDKDGKMHSQLGMVRGLRVR